MNKPTTTVYAEPVVATPVVQQQPGATPAATLVTNGSSNYVYVPPKDVFASSTGPNEWKHNICDCCTNANCCCVAMNILFPHVADMCFYSNAVAASGVDPDRIFSNNETLRTNQQQLQDMMKAMGEEQERQPEEAALGPRRRRGCRRPHPQRR